MEKIFGSIALLRGDGTTAVSAEAFAGKKYAMLYFSGAYIK